MSKIVYKILNKDTGNFEGSYTRGNYDKFEWDSEWSALNANVHGIYKDGNKYEIKKYKVTYELIEEGEE